MAKQNEPNADEKQKTSALGPRETLIEAGLTLFGTRGYEGVSVREICDAARMNIAAINYHFGGKEGLYRAVALHIRAQLQDHMSDQMISAMEYLQSENHDPDEAVERLIAIYRGMIRVLVPGSERTARWAKFIVKYQLGEDVPSHELDNLEMIRAVAGLIGIARGRTDDERGNTLIGLTLFGQILVFRINRKSSLRVLDVSEIGPNEVDLIEATVLSNIRAILNAERQSND
ncbi:MAG: CerR family C-terminal domain-containing protein [Pseudomonadota bacterium]